MNKKDTSVIRLVIYLIGVVIIGLIDWLVVMPLEPELWRSVMVGVIAFLVFSAIFLPLTISAFKNVAGTVVSGVVYYRGAVSYSIINAGLTFSMEFLRLSRSYVIAIMLVSLFVFLLYLFLAGRTAVHIDEVAQGESDKKATVMSIRSLSEQLYIQSQSLGEDNNNLKNRIVKLKNDFRYLSPSDDVTAKHLEKEIENRYRDLVMSNSFANLNSISLNMIERTLNEIESLYLQRKAIF